MARKKIEAGDAFAGLLGKLLQVPKEEAAEAFAQQFPAAGGRMRPAKPKRKKARDYQGI